MNYSALLKLASKFEKLAVIQHPPRNLRIFLDLIPKKINQVLGKFNYLGSLPETIDEYVLKDYLNNFLGLSAYDLKYFNFLSQNCEKHVESLLHLIEIVKSGNSYEFKKFIDYIIDRINYILEILNTAIPKIQDFVDEGKRNYSSAMEWEMSSPERIKAFKENYGEVPEDLSSKLFELPEAISALVSNLEDAVRKLSVLTQPTKNVDSDDTRPKSDDIETLYHATINASSILNSGFSNDRSKVEGIGGSNNLKSGKPGISFTSDFYVAKEVARSLKEMIMIANGELKARHILHWADLEGIKEEVLGLYKGVSGDSLELDSIEGTAELYHYYLCTTKSRYNPFFFGAANIVRNLRGRSSKDVGIIVAEVNMRHPDNMYFTAMHEFRVPAEAVLKIKDAIF